MKNCFGEYLRSKSSVKEKMCKQEAPFLYFQKHSKNQCLPAEEWTLNRVTQNPYGINISSHFLGGWNEDVVLTCSIDF